MSYAFRFVLAVLVWAEKTLAAEIAAIEARQEAIANQQQKLQGEAADLAQHSALATNIINTLQAHKQ